MAVFDVSSVTTSLGDTINVVDETARANLKDKLGSSLKGAASGLAELDANGKVPSSQLPSYVDDVLEGYISSDAKTFYKTKAANGTLSDPYTDADKAGKIYVDISNNKTYRWSGSAFVPISESLALGTTQNTAFRGDWGKIAYDHVSKKDNPHGVTAEQVGAAPASHTHDDRYLKSSGGEMTGPLTFVNDEANPVGDDFLMGDFNVAGTLALQGTNGVTGVGLLKKGEPWSSAADFALVTYDGGNLVVNRTIQADITGSASSVPWSGVTDRPTNVSQFANDAKYVKENHNHDDRYLKLSGGEITGRVDRASGGSWISGRDNATVFNTSQTETEGTSWNPVCGVKTAAGSWTMGTVGGEQFGFSHDTDADHSAGTNSSTRINLPLKNGDIAVLTKYSVTLSASNWKSSGSYYYYDLGSSYGNDLIVLIDGDKNNQTQYEDAIMCGIVGSSSTKLWCMEAGSKPSNNITVIIYSLG